MLNFTEAQHDFFSSNVSFALPYLSKSPFRNYAVGDLSVEVASMLLRAGSAYRSLFGRMRLVNIGSTHTGFSYGVTKVDQTPGVHFLTLTFSIGRKDVPLTSDLIRRPLTNNVVIYGDKTDGVQFVSVGISSVKVAEFGITNMQPRALRYLYMSAGVVLRSIFRRHSRVDMDADAIEAYHKHLSRNVVGQLPLANAFQTPYERWTWQRSVWSLCPNLISFRCINPYSASRLLDILPSTSIDYRNAAYTMIWDESDSPNHTTLFDLIEKSMRRFISAVDTQDVSVPDQTGLLFPALLYSLVFRGQVGFAVEVETIYPQLVSLFDERNQELNDLFSPSGLTVRRMLEGNADMVKKLSDAIDIFKR